MDKMNKKYLSLVLGIFLLTLVCAIQITNFNGFGNNENLTFTGDQNFTRTITLYKNAGR